MPIRSRTARLAATFHSFSFLPPELRIHIWEHAISQRPSLLPRAPIPSRALLTTCRESRSVFLSIFTLCFHPVMHQVMHLIKWPVSLYGNLKRDILYIDPEMDDLAVFDRELDEWLTPVARGRNGIKHAAIEKEYWRELDPANESSMFDNEQDQRLKLAGLEGLLKMTLVLNDYDVVDLFEDPPALDERILLEYSDKVVELEDSKVFHDIAQNMPGRVLPEINIGRIIYD
ncbi:hypothetical protein BKA64DRAFT_187471 [Cadophora sp. MPI-SDFR-AT-0126]|nr:hypothetical protein BKA64DRAFT_187471 [Leotiomycetes sp. MPI-SDFR-AT-0126]